MIAQEIAVRSQNIGDTMGDYGPGNGYGYDSTTVEGGYSDGDHSGGGSSGEEAIVWVIYLFTGGPLMFLLGTGVWALICNSRHVSMDSQSPAPGLSIAIGFAIFPPLLRGLCLIINWILYGYEDSTK